MSAIIYRLTNTINQKTYIGQTSRGLEERWREHLGSTTRGSSAHLHNAIRKYGPDAFTREVLEETTIDLMNDRERHWIAEYAPEYNMTAGGEGARGVSRTPETREKIAAAKRGKPLTPETRAKISAALRGKSPTPETRAKMSAACTGEKNHNYGKPKSPETRAKLSAAKRGRPLSPETRAKMSAVRRGRKHTDETRAKISAANRNRYSK